jgi:hypothetical protein
VTDIYEQELADTREHNYLLGRRATRPPVVELPAPPEGPQPSGTVEAWPVVDHRCAHCGSVKSRISVWTPGAILRAIHKWAVDHGEPPRLLDWANAAPDHPANTTVRDMFGSWGAAVRAAGYKTYASGGPAFWSREAMINTVLDEITLTGRVPRANEWRVAASHRPAGSTVKNAFGSWNEFLLAAGVRPDRIRRAKGGRRKVTEGAARSSSVGSSAGGSKEAD